MRMFRFTVLPMLACFATSLLQHVTALPPVRSNLNTRSSLSKRENWIRVPSACNTNGLSNVEYDFDVEVGSGTSGIVHPARENPLNPSRNLVVKVEETDDMTTAALLNQRARNTLLVAYVTEQRYLMQTKAVCFSGSNDDDRVLYYVMERIVGSSLETLINSRNYMATSNVAQATFRNTILKLLRTLASLHAGVNSNPRVPVSHNDLNSGSFMLRQSDQEIILVDFDTAMRGTTETLGDDVAHAAEVIVSMALGRSSLQGVYEEWADFEDSHFNVPSGSKTLSEMTTSERQNLLWNMLPFGPKVIVQLATAFSGTPPSAYQLLMALNQIPLAEFFKQAGQ